MTSTVLIGIIGDFNPDKPTHIATNASIEHAAQALGTTFVTVWLPTDEPAEYAKFDGLLCSPGSPYRSFEGALAGIRYARENDTPLIGTCGGFQHLVIEYGRNVVGFQDAAHAETDPDASCLFVTPLSCSFAGRTMGVAIKPGSRAAAAFNADRSEEAFYCSFGLNPLYRQHLEAAGLDITGEDTHGEARIVELASHPFFVGTLFVPQVRSSPGEPHPVMMEFCRSAARHTILNASCSSERPLITASAQTHGPQ